MFNLLICPIVKHWQKLVPYESTRYPSHHQLMMFLGYFYGDVRAEADPLTFWSLIYSKFWQY